MNGDLVSVIMPTYNSSRYVAESIRSIEAQTYTNWELLITDDCSVDDTVRIVSEFADRDKRIKLTVLAQNSGAGVARNESIKRAEGRYLAFCDSDDRWEPEKLSIQLRFMKANGYELTYTSYSVCRDDGERIGAVRCKSRLSYFTLLCDNGIGCLTAMYDTSRIGKIYMPTIRKRQDWGLWLAVIKRTKYAYGLPNDYLSIYRQGNGISSNKVKLIKSNYAVYHELEGYSAIVSMLLLTFCFVPSYIFKKIKNRV